MKACIGEGLAHRLSLNDSRVTLTLHFQQLYLAFKSAFILLNRCRHLNNDSSSKVMTTNGSDLIIQQKVQWVQELLGLTNNVDLNVCNEQSLNSKLDLAPATDTSSSDNITPQSSQPIALVEADSTEKCRLANDEMRERMEVIGDPSTADKMGTQPKKVRHHQIHPRKGALAPVNQAFCPLDAVSKYPYLFVPAQVSEPIAEKFFNDGKFWHRKWDM